MDLQRLLLLAARAGSLEMVKIILDSNPRLLDHSTVLFIAAGNGRIDEDDIEEVTTRLGGGPEFEGEHTKICKLLLERGVNINAATEYGVTALHCASCTDVETVKVLINNGANPNAKDSRSTTPLHVAAYCNMEDIAEFLISSGADVNAVDDEGETPLMYAASQCSTTEIAEVLLGRGAYLNRPGHSSSPLRTAIWHERVEFSKFLLEKGADVNEKDDKGWTALHSAAYKGSTKGVSLLLGYGATVNAETEKNLTPLDIAVSKNHTAAAEILLKHGARAVGG